MAMVNVGDRSLQTDSHIKSVGLVCSSVIGHLARNLHSMDQEVNSRNDCGQDGVTVKPRLHDTTCCQTGCQTGLTTG